MIMPVASRSHVLWWQMHGLTSGPVKKLWKCSAVEFRKGDDNGISAKQSGSSKMPSRRIVGVNSSHNVETTSRYGGVMSHKNTTKGTFGLGCTSPRLSI